MTLTAAVETSSASLSSLSSQTALVSRNIAGAGNENYARKSARLVTGLDGAGHVASIARATNIALRNTALTVSSAAETQQALANGYDQISATLDDSTVAQSPSAALAALTDALQQLSASPANPSLAADALRTAYGVADRLNDATDAVQQIRKQADGDIGASVSRINDLLSQFKEVDSAIVRNRTSGADVTTDEDRRDELLASISKEIGISSATRPNGSTAIYTDGGAVLFDKEPRVVSFTATGAFAPGVVGNAVTVDGVDVSSPSSTQASTSGKLVGLAQVRDQVTVRYQAQLDETARGLINAFAERDQSTLATLPDAPGLFVDAASASLPGAALSTGLAGRIRVNAAVDPAKGGTIDRIRDGGSAGGGNPAYSSNATGAAGFSARLRGLITTLSQPVAFDAQAGIATNATLSGYTIASINDVESGRKVASDGATQQGALRDRTEQALQSETGVNLDDELSKLLDLEHAYGASAKLLSTVDGLYASLFQAIH